MSDRDSNTPLTVSAVLSVVLHVVLALALTGWFHAAEANLPSNAQAAVGELMPDAVAINWISHADFEKQMTRHLQPHDQAAQQKTAKADPKADQTPNDPTDPGPKKPDLLILVPPKGAKPSQASPKTPTPPVPVTKLQPETRSPIPAPQPKPTPPDPSTAKASTASQSRHRGRAVTGQIDFEEKRQPPPPPHRRSTAKRWP